VVIPSQRFGTKYRSNLQRSRISNHYSLRNTLTAKDENNLRIFEWQILRKILGPVDIDNTWRIRNNMEIDKLIEVQV
jgi:hypothetical protein